MRAIVADPHIQAGVPTIRGTRVSTRAIWSFRRAGYFIIEIVHEYPSLSHEHIWAAILFERRRRQRTQIRVCPRRRAPLTAEETR